MWKQFSPAEAEGRLLRNKQQAILDKDRIAYPGEGGGGCIEKIDINKQ